MWIVPKFLLIEYHKKHYCVPTYLKIHLRPFGSLFFMRFGFGIEVTTNMFGQCAFAGRAVQIMLSNKGCMWAVYKYPEKIS